MKLKKLLFALLALLLTGPLALAHKPLLSVEDNEDGTIYIETGFSDGSSGAGHSIIIKDKAGKVLSEKKVPAEGSMDIPMPKVPYTVTFYAGKGHSVDKEGPFSAQQSAKESAEEPAKEKSDNPLPAPTPVQSAVQSAPIAAMPANAVNPQIMMPSSVQQSPGAAMAMKMMLTTNIVIGVLLAFILSLISFWIGYTVAKAK